MAQLRTPLLQPYLNPWTASITPFSMASHYSGDQTAQMRQTPPRKSVSPKSRKYRNYSYLMRENTYNKTILNYLSQKRVSLLDIQSSQNDFQFQDGVVHVLELRPLEEDQQQLDELATIASVYIEQMETTSINSFKNSINQEIINYSCERKLEPSHYFQ